MSEEDLTFDKFMDDILLKEHRQKKKDIDNDDDLPPMLRQSIIRREHPGHKIKYDIKNGGK